MNIDLKLEAEKIAEEIISGTVEQACFYYESILGNYQFLTSSRIEKRVLNTLGSHLAKHARKNPENFLYFCKRIWYKKIRDGRPALGFILAVLETINPDVVIPEIEQMCFHAAGSDDVDTLVLAFEPVILKNPPQYLPLLKDFMKRDNVWIKRMIIITMGHLMFRYKTAEITRQCLEIIRPELYNGDDHVRKTASWVIGSYGVRADQRAVAGFMQSFAGSANSYVVQTFVEAFRRSKITLQPDISSGLIPMFGDWSRSPDPKIRKSAQSALKILQKQA